MLFFDSKESSNIRFYTRSPVRANEIKSDFGKIKGRGLRVGIRFLKCHDWFDKWQVDYHMASLGSRFVVVPVWKKKVWDKTKSGFQKRIPIFLDPAGAFGSGTHETTRLTVSLIEKAAGGFESFFDAGTGTGILSVVAGKLGG